MNYDLEKELDKCETMEDLTGRNGLVQRLIGSMVEKILEKELDGHLGYEKHAVKGNNTGNSSAMVSSRRRRLRGTYKRT